MEKEPEVGKVADRGMWGYQNRYLNKKMNGLCTMQDKATNKGERHYFCDKSDALEGGTGRRTIPYRDAKKKVN